MNYQYVGFFLLVFIFAKCVNGNSKPGANTEISQHDKVLSKQLEKYNKLVFEGKIDEALEFTSPLIFDYMLSKNKGEFHSMSDVQESYKLFLEESYQGIKNRKLKVSNEIGDVLKTIKINPYLIKIVEVKTVVVENNIKDSIKDQIISFSEDEGKTWKFINNDKEIIFEVLSLKFNKESIKEILGADPPKKSTSEFDLKLISKIISSYTFYNSEVIYKNYNTNDEKIMVDEMGITVSKLMNGCFRIKDVKNDMIMKFSHVEEGPIYVYKIVKDFNEVFERVQVSVDLNKVCKGEVGNFAIDFENSPFVWIYKLKK